MKKMYTIGQVSELFDLPKSTIRYWDEQGLIRSSRLLSFMQFFMDSNFRGESMKEE
ncbi:hypothetical protein EfmAA818_25120 [Enterococcus faecium]|nr:hypothetical protein EfmAA818_25120 [Enterococcus faecium]